MGTHSYPGPSEQGANTPDHRVGQSVDTVDQVSSVTLMLVAIAGALLSLVLVSIIPG